MKKYTQEEVNAIHSAHRYDVQDLYVLLLRREKEGDMEVVALVEQMIKMKNEMFAAFLARDD